MKAPGGNRAQHNGVSDTPKLHEPDTARPGRLLATTTHPSRAASGSINDSERIGYKAAATVLTEMAVLRYYFGRSTEDETYAIPRSAPTIVIPLRGGKHSLRAELAREYFDKHNRVASQQALTDSLNTFHGIAQQAEPKRLWLRVAQHQHTTWLDLADSTGTAVRIEHGTWSIEPPPVLFKRTTLTSPLPTPQRGGDLGELWSWLNVTPEDRPLLLAYLIAAFIPDIPHPILGLFGEQGTGKTTTMKILVNLLDPSPVPYRKPPRDSETWITAASGSWFVGIDNVRTIQDWFSDTLCRAVTGEGDVRRRLYTDGELHVFAFRRVIALNGIDLGALHGDLADRLLPITLEPIGEHERRGETELSNAFKDAHPRLLGAILDVAARVLHQLPTVALASRPRMADFAHVVATLDAFLGTRALDRYLGAQGRIAADSLTGDPFMVRLLEAIHEPFEGTSAELLDELRPDTTQNRIPSDWPRSARATTQLLRRQAPVLRKAGWTVIDDDGANKQGTIRWTIGPPRENPRSQPPPLLPTRLTRQAQSNQAANTTGDAHHCAPPLASTPPEPRHTSDLQNAATREAGQAGQISSHTPDLLQVEAAQIAAELRHLDPATLRKRCDEALTLTHGTPSWWRDTAITEPHAVTVALELIARHHRSQTLMGSAHAYLAAARTVVKEAA